MNSMRVELVEYRKRWHWRVRAPGGKHIVFRSTDYRSEAECREAIKEAATMNWQKIAVVLVVKS